MRFTIHPDKDYKTDIEIICKALASGKRLSFSKFCDGEWAVIENRDINNSEFWFEPDKLVDTLKRQKLIESFQFQHENYYVGVACPGVFGEDMHKEMKELSKQPPHRLTWADIWVNSNYRYYIENVLPLFKDRPTVLYCNGKSNVANLPFTPTKVFEVSYNAWAHNWDLIEKSKQYITENNLEDHTFLFCCGPFGNILCHQLTEFNEKNTYLDIGSTLNPFLGSAGFERDYYMGDGYFARLVGEWI